MKKLFFAIAGLLISMGSYSQDYYPTVGEDKTWDVLNIITIVPFDTTWATTVYYMGGDTVINSLTYKKIIYPDIPEAGVYRCMREDASKKVWMYEIWTGEEILMYDYSLQPGDSILLGNMVFSFMHVDSVTMITVDGTQRHRYWLSAAVSYGNYYENWIEGIGSDKGITNSGSAYFVGGHSWLLCMLQGSELVYMNPNYTECAMYSAVGQKQEPQVEICPNPASDRIMINGNGKFTGEIAVSLINIEGKEIFRDNFRGLNNINIDSDQ